MDDEAPSRRWFSDPESRFTRRMDNTQPAILPATNKNWVINTKRVVRRSPPYEGIFFRFKKRRIPFPLNMELVEEASPSLDEARGTAVVEVEVVVSGGDSGVSLSAGCLAGSAGTWEVLRLLSSTCKSSLYPISPRFDGKGPASGFDWWGVVELEAFGDEVGVVDIVCVQHCHQTSEEEKNALGKRSGAPINQEYDAQD